MKLILPAGLIKLAELFNKNGYRLYCVGGSVRNALLGLPYSDIDICSAMMPEDVFSMCEKAGLSCKTVNKRLGTMHIDIGEETEYTTFRTESYPKGGGHEPEKIEIGVSMEKDALRRDFSVNALYYDILSDEILDPTGKGLSDLSRRTLSTTSADPSFIMQDDALRMMRLCRFSAELNFKISADAAKYVRDHSYLIHDISRERIFAELKRLLLADTKYKIEHKMPAHKRGLLALIGCGLLKEIFPEFSQAGEIGKSKYHSHSVLFHSIATASLMPPALDLRLAGLLHDIAKPELYFKNGNMHGHEELGEKIAYERLSALKAPKKLINNVCDTVRWHMYDLTGAAKESTVRRQIVKMGEESFKRLIIIRRADVYGSGKTPFSERVTTADRFEEILKKMHEQNAPFTLKELNISGTDLIEAGIASGSELSPMLDRLLSAAAANPRLNTKERLLNRAKTFKIK